MPLNVVAVAPPERGDVLEGVGVVGVWDDALGEEALRFADRLGAILYVRDADGLDDGAVACEEAGVPRDAVFGDAFGNGKRSSCHIHLL